MRSRRVSTNQAQSALLPSSARARSETAEADRPHVSNQGMQQMLRAGTIQAKLSVSQPGDRFEQEADRVADAVMRMPRSTRDLSQASGQTPTIQRMCTECEEEVHRKPSPSANAGDLEFHHPGAEGQPLPDSERKFFESRLGQDFSQVRVHADAQASAAAQSVNALAYTKGRDVVFGAGQYRPGTNSGRSLLAHELTHVVQQGAAKPERRSTTSTDTARPTISTTTAAGTLARQPEPVRTGDPSQAPAGMACPVATTSPPNVVTNVLFGVNSSALTPAGLADITAFIANWNAAGADDQVRVDGFASTDGPEPLNWTLSCDRALIVENELMAPSSGAPGIPANFLENFAQGETNQFSTSLPPNRRATISADLSVPPPPVCANPGVIRRLDLQPVFLRSDPADAAPTGGSWTRRFNEANRIWGKIGVTFNDLGPVTLDTPLKTTGATNAEQNAIAALRTAAGIEVYLVDNDVGSGVPGGSGGASTAPGCGAAGNVVMSDRGSSDTILAHELGHILGINHPTDAVNPGDAGTIMEGSGSHSADNPTTNTMVNFGRILCPPGIGTTCLNPDP